MKFVGTGEKFDALEPFHPERMASRILGMGDMLTLIEKAQEDYDEQKAQELESVCARISLRWRISWSRWVRSARWAGSANCWE